MEKILLTPSEASKLMRTRIETIYSLLEHGEIPGYKERSNWKIPKKLLEEYIFERAIDEAKQRRIIASSRSNIIQD